MKIKLEAGETVTGCPMCGGYASLHSTSIGAIQMEEGQPLQPQYTMFWCRCDGDDCGVGQRAVNGRENAIARWNRRTR